MDDLVAVPQNIIDFLKLREGVKTHVYLDTLRKPTCGMGHLLSQDENNIYSIGERVPDSVINAWAKVDSSKAFHTAIEQSKILGTSSQDFIKVLTSVNFQLGTKWVDKFKNIWDTMVKHNWEYAAYLITFTKWHKQTPVRTKDLIDALNAMAGGHS